MPHLFEPTTVNRMPLANRFVRSATWEGLADPQGGATEALAELLAEDDVIHLAAAMDPGSVAGVLIWENLWAAPFASAVRRSGGQLIANGRIPIQAIIASIEADEVDNEGA